MFDIEYKQEFNNIETKIRQNEINKVERITKKSINTYLKYITLEIFKYNQKVLYEIKSWRIVYDGFNNPYLYVEFNPYGLMIISLINNESVIINPFINSDNLEKYRKSQKLNLDFKTLKVNNLDINDIETFNLKSKNNVKNTILSTLKENYYSIENNLNNLSLNDKYEKLFRLKKTNISNNIISSFNKRTPEIYNPSHDEFLSVEKEISYSWWFRTAIWDEEFGYTNDEKLGYSEEGQGTGLCHYVALAMLLQYAEFFYSRDVFSEEQIKKYIIKRDQRGYAYYPKWSEKYPIIPEISINLVKDLWQIYGKGAIKTTSLYLRQVAEYFIHEYGNRYDKKPNVTFHRRSAGWIKPWKWINDNKPCIIFGTGIPSGDPSKQKTSHAIVAYGYNDKGNKLLCHYGYKQYNQVLVSSSLSGQLWLIGVSKTGNDKKPREYFYHNGKYISGVDFK